MDRRGVTGWLLAAALVALGLAGGAWAQELPARCTGLCRADRAGHFVSRPDLFVAGGRLTGDDLLAPVDRTPSGTLPPDFAPDDLVDLESMRPMRAHRCTPPAHQCLRREAARAYRSMARAMREAGQSPHVSSAFRAYRVQCSTFLGWAQDGGFCEATTSSALPGHSEHQLGTTLDLFTYGWTNEGNKFRPGYGCSPGGRWIAEHAHEHGFVLSYPLHPDYRREGSECAAIEGGEERIDPRTGYRYEPWHLRYVGVDAAARFREARQRSGPGTLEEITLGQWLARRAGRERTNAPVCDGCNCDRCATVATGDDAPCETPALRLASDGTVLEATEPPRLRSARLSREGGTLLLEARLSVPQNTWTQPPVVSETSAARYRRGTRAALLPEAGPRRYPAMPDAHRLVIGFDRRDDWPWSAALVTTDRDGSPNGLLERIPASPGELTVMVPMDGVSPGTLVRVGLARGRDATEAFRERAP